MGTGTIFVQHKYLFLFILTMILFFSLWMTLKDSEETETSSSLSSSLSFQSLPIPMKEFPEPLWRTSSTIDAKTIVSTSFARFEIHQVKTETGVIIDDWLWTDERSHVNILVHLKEENKYLLFYQIKYGLSEPAYATIGGLFEKGETGHECATRELLEETGLITEDLVSLGKYRVQVNRGGGYLYAYLAKNCVRAPNSKPSDDYEKQEKRLLTRKELIEVALQGKVGEAQWVATIALGLLHEEFAH